MPRRPTPTDPTKPHHLTAASVATLTATGRAYIVRDTKLPGFAARVGPTGQVGFILDYRVRGDKAKHRHAFGLFPMVTPEAARMEAERMKARAAAGMNPREEVNAKRAARAEAKAARAAERAATIAKARHTVRQLAEDFITDRGAQLGPRTLRLYRSVVHRTLTGDLGARPIADVTADDVRDLLRTLAAGTLPAGVVPTKGRTTRVGGVGAARTLRRFLAAVWRYAREDRALPLAAGVVPVASKLGLGEATTERFLSPAECAALLRALETAGTVGLPPAPHRKRRPPAEATAKHRPKLADTPTPANPVALAAIRFTLLTGWRKSEVLTLRWDMLRRDLGLVILPETKTGESVRAMSAGAWALLDTIPRTVGSPYVFPSPRNGRRPLADPSRLWDAVRHAAGVTDARYHDMRHTAASLAINAGAQLPEVQAMLAHKSARTTERYAKLFPETALGAANRVETALAEAAKTPAPVVRPLRRGRA